MSGIFIVAAKRTPFGAFGGALKDKTATQLGVIATQAALGNSTTSSNNNKINNVIAPELVDAVYFGNVLPSSSDAAYLARHIALQSGMNIATPALTTNRLCGSGFETVVQAVKSIALHEAQVVVAGGTENMSMAPFTTAAAAAQSATTQLRFGTVPLGAGIRLSDSLWDALTDAHCQTPMGITAENLALKYNITRRECDEYAISSQQRWAAAQQAGLFEAEMAPVEILHPKKKTTTVMDTDEHPRPDTTLDKISALPPVFPNAAAAANGGGVVTAANASGICDGAGAIVVASERAVLEHRWTPLARIVSYAVVGCEPTIMGIGPVPAIRAALATANISSLDDVDRIEINEAFAAQFLACARELSPLDMQKTNLHGGAISLGHPLAASGSRITAHLAHEFHQPNSSNNKIHVGAACIGGGQGIALVLERA